MVSREVSSIASGACWNEAVKRTQEPGSSAQENFLAAIAHCERMRSSSSYRASVLQRIPIIAVAAMSSFSGAILVAGMKYAEAGARAMPKPSTPSRAGGMLFEG